MQERTVSLMFAVLNTIGETTFVLVSCSILRIFFHGVYPLQGELAPVFVFPTHMKFNKDRKK